MADVSTPTKSRQRIGAIDIARAVALFAMASYHFTWDLGYFGYVDPELAIHGGWKLYARCIASSFLILVGVSLVLAHGNGIRWKNFAKRFAEIVAAALLITVATYFFSPQSYIFFGILHEIALASLLGLLFLRAPVWLLVPLAALFVAAPFYLANPVFNQAALWWVGLSTVEPITNDYVPLFPWFGAVLAGMALARIGQQTGAFAALSPLRLWPQTLDKGLRFLGRHSLVFYLVHQPILIGLVFLAVQIHPPATRSPSEIFGSACEANCSQTDDHAFCQRFCRCVIGDLQAAKLFDDVYKGRIDPRTDPRVASMSAQCSLRAEEK